MHPFTYKVQTGRIINQTPWSVQYLLLTGSQNSIYDVYTREFPQTGHIRANMQHLGKEIER